MHTTSGRFTHTGYVVVGADPLRQESVADFPREDRRTLSLVLRDFGDHLRCGDPGFAASDRPRSYGASLIISAQYFAHAAVGDLHVGNKKDNSHTLFTTMKWIFWDGLQIIFTLSVSSTWTSWWVYEHKRYALNWGIRHCLTVWLNRCKSAFLCKWSEYQMCF